VDAGAVDFGDVPPNRWRSRREGDEPNNVEAVVEGLRSVTDRVSGVVEAGYRPLVIGGECTVTIGVLSALVERELDLGLVYVDGGQDLMTPAEHPEEPILDAMGVAHMLDLPGTDDRLAGFGPVRPLLTPPRLVFYGFSDEEEDVHGRVPCLRVSADAVTADAKGTAERAAAALAGAPFVVHVDVDVLDFLRSPVADIAVFGRGLSLGSLATALTVLLADPRCAALVVVEVNPDHDPDGSAVPSLVDTLGRVLEAAAAP
jgi:arginase